MPDLILCHLRQPAVRGEEAQEDADLALLHTVRADPTLGHVPFFFFTDREPADEEAATRRRIASLEAGADDILPLGRLGKPEFLARLRGRLSLTLRRGGYTNSPAGLREVLESITDGFFALDREWRFTDLNPQA